MNTEPPTGDDLNRMLVSMKKNVLERATAADRKPRHRTFGIVIALIAVVGVGSASGAVALGLVPQPFAGRAPAPVATHDPTPTPSTTPPSAPTPTPTPPPAPVASLPTDCESTVPAADYTRLFGATPFEQLRPIPAGATPQPIPIPTGAASSFYSSPALFCVWRDPRADVSSLTVEIGTSAETALSDYQSTLESQGYTCSEIDGGRSCQRVTRDTQYPVDVGATFFVRDGTWIEVRQVNVPTNNLLGAIVERVWG